MSRKNKAHVSRCCCWVVLPGLRGKWLGEGPPCQGRLPRVSRGKHSVRKLVLLFPQGCGHSRGPSLFPQKRAATPRAARARRLGCLPLRKVSATLRLLCSMSARLRLGGGELGVDDASFTSSLWFRRREAAVKKQRRAMSEALVRFGGDPPRKHKPSRRCCGCLWGSFCSEKTC